MRNVSIQCTVCTVQKCAPNRHSEKKYDNSRPSYPLRIHNLNMTTTQSEIGEKKVGNNDIADTNGRSGNGNIQKELSTSSQVLIKEKQTNIQKERKFTLFYNILLLILGSYLCHPQDGGVFWLKLFAMSINSKNFIAKGGMREQSLCKTPQMHLGSRKYTGIREQPSDVAIVGNNNRYKKLGSTFPSPTTPKGNQIPKNIFILPAILSVC